MTTSTDVYACSIESPHVASVVGSVEGIGVACCMYVTCGAAAFAFPAVEPCFLYAGLHLVVVCELVYFGVDTLGDYQ